MSWKPISEEMLLEKINRGRLQMNPLERRFWDAVCITPEKWKLTPYGDLGGGFWVVAVLGSTVVWYNDVENGFNRSRYARFGTIPQGEYWCNQDELQWTIGQLRGFVVSGENPGGQSGPPIVGEYAPQ
ncbi:MAG TPA: hypothetical protein VMA34_13850 [Terracidiphilus sp.]|nr:hypothetical protein [Terracidiphilus sp.]